MPIYHLSEVGLSGLPQDRPIPIINGRRKLFVFLSNGKEAPVRHFWTGPKRTPLPDDEIKDILPWIPPRPVCHVDVGSIAGAKARGIYIDSFISPDRLEAAYMHENIARVRGAAACAIKAGEKIVSLGGFSSILIEGNYVRREGGVAYA
jgi:predicted amino acid dehydrogenase